MHTSIQLSLKNQIIPILKKQGVKKAAFFGSVARSQTNSASDIDLLVQLSNKKSLLDFIDLKLELENKLKRKVDLLSYGGIDPLLKSSILQNQVLIYEKT